MLRPPLLFPLIAAGKSAVPFTAFTVKLRKL